MEPKIAEIRGDDPPPAATTSTSRSTAASRPATVVGGGRRRRQRARGRLGAVPRPRGPGPRGRRAAGPGHRRPRLTPQAGLGPGRRSRRTGATPATSRTGTHPLRSMAAGGVHLARSWQTERLRCRRAAPDRSRRRSRRPLAGHRDRPEQLGRRRRAALAGGQRAGSSQCSSSPRTVSPSCSAAPAWSPPGRRPVNTPVVDVAVRRRARRGGRDVRPRGPPARHHHGPARHPPRAAPRPAAAARALGAPVRARPTEVVRLHRHVARQLAGQWYDEADLLHAARRRTTAYPALRRAVPAGAAHADRATVDRGAGHQRRRARDQGNRRAPRPRPRRGARRQRCRRRGQRGRPPDRRGDQAGVALERIAAVWPIADPYARLLTEHLDAAGIQWNGRPASRSTSVSRRDCCSTCWRSTAAASVAPTCSTCSPTSRTRQRAAAGPGAALGASVA